MSLRVFILVSLLACCAIANGIGVPNIPVPIAKLNLPNNIPNVPDVKLPSVTTPDINLPKVTFPPNLPAFLPGFGKRKTCPASLSIADYINCCGPQGTCDASKVTQDLKPEKLMEVSCQAVSKGISSMSQLDSLLSGLSSKSSSCLSSAIGSSFQKFHGSISTWNLNTFSKLPNDALASFNISSLKKVPKSFLMDDSGLRKMGIAMGKMTEDQISSMVPGLKDALGDFKQWGESTLNKMLTNAPKYLCGMSSKDTSEIKPTTMTNSIHLVGGAVKGCRNAAHSKNIARTFVRGFAAEHGDISTWSRAHFIRLQDLKGELNSADLQKLSTAVLTDARTLPKADTSFSARQKQAIADAVRTNFLPGSDSVNADFVKMVLNNVSSLLTSLPDSDLDKANCSLVGEYFLQSASSQVSEQSLKTVIQKVKQCGFNTIKTAGTVTFSGATDLASFSKSHIASVAPYLSGFLKIDIDKMDLKTAFDDISSDAFSTVSDALSSIQGSAVVSKLTSGSSRVPLNRLHKLGKFLTAHDVSTLAKPFSFEEIKNASVQGFKVPKDVASQFADTALKSLGTDFADTDKFPSNTIFNDLGDTIVKGFNRTTFRNLPQDGLDGFVSSAAKFDLSAGQVQEMAKRYSKDLVMTFDEQMVRGLGQVVAHFNSSVMSGLSADGKAQVARNLGQAPKLLGFAGQKNRIMDLASKANQWLRPNNEALTYAHVQSLGSLVHFLPSSFINGLSKDDLQAAVSQLSQTPVGEAAKDTKTRLQNVANVVHQKLKEPSNGLDKDVVKNLGKAVCYLPDSFFNAINSKAKFDAIADTLGDADCDKNSMAAKTVLNKAKMYHTKNTNQARNLGPTILRTMNKTLPAMSMDDLKSLPAETIKDSLETFGQAGFSLDQAKELVNKIVPGSAEGFTARRRRQSAPQASLTSSQVQSLGSLACALRTNALVSFSSDIDSMCSLSRQMCYTNTQKSAILTELKKKMDISSWPADMFSCLGEWATHLAASDISKMRPEMFKMAARSFGKLVYDNDGTRKALGKAATDSFGDNVGSWPAGIVQSIGNITGYLGLDNSAMGCSTTKVQSMTADQIGTIDPSVIPNMKNLKCMSNEQLMSFDGEQARAVTPAQASLLTSSQQTVLASMSCEPDCGAVYGSGANGVTATFMVVVTTMLFAALF